MALKGIKLRLRSNGRWDLDLDNIGKIKTVTGSDKLAIQVARAVMNSSVLGGFINTPVTDISGERIVSNLSRFKNSQILMTNEIPATFQGYKIYKSLDAINYKLLTPVIIEKIFIDEEVRNDIQYFYGFTMIEDDIESDIFGITPVRPTKDTSLQNIYILGNIMIEEGNGRIIFRFRNKREFSSAELLDKIQGVEVIKGTPEEPRLVQIRVRISNLARRISDLTLRLGEV